MVDIITQSDSEWFGSKAGLVLENPRAITPIPCAGALGYFAWGPSGDLTPHNAWMRRFDPASEDGAPALFPDLDHSFRAPPPKPFGRKPD